MVINLWHGAADQLSSSITARETIAFLHNENPTGERGHHSGGSPLPWKSDGAGRIVREELRGDRPPRHPRKRWRLFLTAGKETW